VVEEKERIVEDRKKNTIADEEKAEVKDFEDIKKEK